MILNLIGKGIQRGPWEFQWEEQRKGNANCQTSWGEKLTFIRILLTYFTRAEFIQYASSKKIKRILLTYVTPFYSW